MPPTNTPQITGTANVDLGSAQSSNSPFAAINTVNVPSTDMITVTVSTGTLSFNGGPQVTSYTDTVEHIANIQALVFTQGSGPANVTFTAYATSPSSPAAQAAETVSCFVAGTMISCPGGARAVETLVAGDAVLTTSGEEMTVRFAGRRAIDLAGDASYNPVRIPAGALGDGVPSRTLRLSPDHAVLIEGVLVPARALIGGPIVQEAFESVTYYHLQLDRHAVILAENAPCETLLDTDDHSGFDNACEGIGNEVFLAPCAPRITQGDIVDRARLAIAARLSIYA